MSDPALLERIASLESAVHRLTAVVQSRLAPPVEVVPLGEAVRRAGVGERTLRYLIAAGVLTDSRSGKRQGSKILLLADELDVLRAEGPDAVVRFRERMGRE